MSVYGNRVKVNTATTGTGTVTLGAASSNAFCTFAEAGIATGSSVTYEIEEGNDFEIGIGVYTLSGLTLTRATVLKSKIGGTAGTTKMTLAGAATVRVIVAAEDMDAKANTATTRTKLEAPLTLYVATTGNDTTGDGTSGNPWANVQRAIDYILVGLDLGYNDVTVQVADGTYTPDPTVNKHAFFYQAGVVGTGRVIIQGNTTTPANVVFDLNGQFASIHIEDSVVQSVEIKGITFSDSVGTGSWRAFIYNNSCTTSLTVGSKVVFGAQVVGVHMWSNGSKFSLLSTTDYTISGGAINHIFCEGNGQFDVESSLITFSGTPNFTGSFVKCAGGGITYFYDNVTVTGSCTGKRFVLDSGGMIKTNTNGNLTLLPGNAAGTATLGSYDDIQYVAGLTIQQDLKLTGVISPAQITGNVDDYAPTGHATASIIRLDGSVDGWGFRGLAGGVAGRRVTLRNVGAKYFNIEDQAATSTAANRIKTIDGGWSSLRPGGEVTLDYDGTDSRWYVANDRPTKATQADQEAATGGNWVTSAVQQNHPSAAKCWVQGTINSTTIISSYNVASLVDTNTGQQQVIINVDMSSASYCVGVTVGETSTALINGASVMSKLAGSYIMNSVIEAGSGDDPSTDWNSWAFGDQ